MEFQTVNRSTLWILKLVLHDGWVSESPKRCPECWCLLPSLPTKKISIDSEDQKTSPIPPLSASDVRFALPPLRGPVE